MDDIERLIAIEAIKELKARYFRSTDTGDAELGRALFTEDCVLDYRGCCTDPATGVDLMPQMNAVLRGPASWTCDAFKSAGIVSVHQGHNCEITLTSDTTASAIWSMTDRFFMPAGSEHPRLTGHGYYHETYEKVGDRWKIKTIRIDRIRVAWE